MKSSQLIIRPAAFSDINLLTDIGCKAFIQSFSHYDNEEDMAKYLASAFFPEKQAAEFSNPGSEFLIAEENRVPIGYDVCNMERKL